MSDPEDQLTSTVRRFGALSEGAKLKGLVRAAHFVTIAARDTYEVGSTGLKDPERLRVANELLHQLLGAAARLGDGEEAYPDDVIVSVIRNMAPKAGISAREIFANILSSDMN